MSSTADDLPVPDFEIDHRNEYAQYLLSDPQEISHYLKQLANRDKLLSAHLDGGKQFFLLGYSCTADDLRVRGYADEQSRENDYARPLSQDPLSLGGVLFELVTMSGSYMFSNPVTCYGNQSMPLLVQGTSLPASISFFVY